MAEADAGLSLPEGLEPIARRHPLSGWVRRRVARWLLPGAAVRRPPALHNLGLTVSLVRAWTDRLRGFLRRFGGAQPESPAAYGELALPLFDDWWEEAAPEAGPLAEAPATLAAAVARRVRPRGADAAAFVGAAPRPPLALEAPPSPEPASLLGRVQPPVRPLLSDVGTTAKPIGSTLSRPMAVQR